MGQSNSRFTLPEVGLRARAARARLGLNQSDVAERVGISNEVYGRLERGLMMPRVKTLLRLCEVLGVEPNDLLLTKQTDGPRNDAMSPELRVLTTFLADADPQVVTRVTEVARWLHKPMKATPRPARAKRPRPARKR